MKRLFSILMVLAMLLAPVALASEVNLQEYPIVDEPITLTMMAPKNAMHGNWEDLWFMQYMEELTGIHWEFNTIPSDSFAEKKNLILASGDLPDLFYGGGLTKGDEVTYGTQGLFIPLNDLIDICMPNFKAAMERWPELYSSCVTLDGNIYALPKIWQTPHAVATKYFINVEWLNELGLEMPSTLDELYEVLCAFRDNPQLSENGTIIPFGGINNSSSQIDQLITAAYGLLGGDSAQLPLYDVIDGEVVFTATTPEYKEALEFIKKLYDEKLIDPEYFTQTGEQFNAKGANVQYGVFSSAAAYVVCDLEDAAAYEILTPLTLNEGDTPVWPKSSGVTNGLAAITVTNPYPEETARWLDYCFSAEGAHNVICGPEGMLWHWEVEGEVWVSEEEKFKESGLGSWSAYKMAYVTPDCGPLAVDTTLFYDLEKLPDVKKAYYDSTWERLDPYLKLRYPDMYYTDEEQTEISSLTVDIESYLEQTKAKFIIGDISLDEFDGEFKATLEKMNLSRLLELQQGAYDRYVANLG